jgi:Mn2+/Fe2+ NRAMP family transporter
MPTRPRRWTKLLTKFGAGLVARGSDNDPTSVATLSVVGSTTVYGLSWLVVLMLPMLLSVQIISARLGLVTHRNLQGVILVRFGRFWFSVSLLLVVGINLLTLTADIQAGAAALNLLSGAAPQIFILPLAFVSGAVMMMGSYRAIQRILEVVLLVFFAYIAAGFLARPNWGDVLHHTIVPTFQFTAAYVAGALALLGATMSSYVYYWETIEEEEERQPLRRLGTIELDAAIGIVFTMVIFWFILISSAATAGVSGIQVQTARDAALALSPLAGELAATLFAVGLLASALLTLPILAATNGYVLVPLLGGRGSIDEPIGRASLPFYTIIAISLALSTGLADPGANPIQLLFLAGIASGLGTPILLALLLVAAADERVMGRCRVRGILSVIGWASAAVIGVASIAYLLFQVLGDVPPLISP